MCGRAVTGDHGEVERGHDRGEDEGQRHEPGQEAQLLGRRALRRLGHLAAEERGGAQPQRQQHRHPRRHPALQEPPGHIKRIKPSKHNILSTLKV